MSWKFLTIYSCFFLMCDKFIKKLIFLANGSQIREYHKIIMYWHLTRSARKFRINWLKILGFLPIRFVLNKHDSLKPLLDTERVRCKCDPLTANERSQLTVRRSVFRDLWIFLGKSKTLAFGKRRATGRATAGHQEGIQECRHLCRAVGGSRQGRFSGRGLWWGRVRAREKER